MGEYIEPFDKEFLKRTKKILKHADFAKYNVTLILNCTLALICLPIERSNNDYKNNPAEYDRLFQSLADKLDELLVIVDEYGQTIPPKQKMKCLRNGIAHIKIEAVNGRNRIHGTIIEGTTKQNGMNYRCAFGFTKNQLTDFAVFMVDQYLKIG